MYSYELLNGCTNVYKGESVLMVQGETEQSLLINLEMCTKDAETQQVLKDLWTQKGGE